jgi:hypothetical protein
MTARGLREICANSTLTYLPEITSTFSFNFSK